MLLIWAVAYLVKRGWHARRARNHNWDKQMVLEGSGTRWSRGGQRREGKWEVGRIGIRSD
jgi:hypothetical protein